MAKVGRPTKYTPELLEAAQAYLKHYGDAGHPVPSVVGLCLSIGISKALAYQWVKDEDKGPFLDILTRVEEMQEEKLISGGLTGGFNPAITKMMLTKHGYSDSQKIDHSSTDGTMAPKGMSHFYANDAESDEE